MVDTEKCFK